MSAQTGVETPRGPASQRLGDRLRFRLERWRAEPNPLWMREMRQSARLLRTPVLLMVLTVLVTLLMSSIGGLLIGGTRSPADAGAVLFQVFFSLAYFVVTLIGPALAANSIASEREGKTWEAVLLTGMRPELVARGKFLAAFTAIAMYIVMLAPVGALPFLFGGVTPVEVLLAFVLLFALALLGVAFGLAISAKMDSLRGALLVTLLLAVVLSVFCYSLFGPAAASLAHEQWPAIPQARPVWLPLAYGRVPFGVSYLVYLVALPLTLLGLPAWLLYEIIRANLTSVTDDRSIGLKRWYVVACVALTAVAFVPLFSAGSSSVALNHIGGMSLYCVFVLFSAFLFAAEEIGPSRRVRRMLAERGPLRRFLAPGVVPTARLLLIGSVAPLVLLGVGGIAVVAHRGLPAAEEQNAQIVVFTVYALGFALFLIGLTAWLRARAKSPGAPRVLLLVTLFLLVAGPWVLAAMAGAMSSGGDSLIAAPSPIYVAVAMEAIHRAGAQEMTGPVVASLVASAAYGVVGAAMALSAARRCHAIIDEHEAMLTEADKRLAAEDAARAAELERAEQELAPADLAPVAASEAATEAGPAEAAPVEEPAPEGQREPRP